MKTLLALWIKKTFTLFNILRLLWSITFACGLVYGLFWFYDLFKSFISNGFLRFLASSLVMSVIMALFVVPTLALFEKYFSNEMKKKK
tara:strand:- start:81 stop:344 length:264 start_codon:yes stop_codon:yes gene_type:complete